MGVSNKPIQKLIWNYEILHLRRQDTGKRMNEIIKNYLSYVRKLVFLCAK